MAFGKQAKNFPKKLLQTGKPEQIAPFLSILTVIYLQNN